MRKILALICIPLLATVFIPIVNGQELAPEQEKLKATMLKESKEAEDQYKRLSKQYNLPVNAGATSSTKPQLPKPNPQVLSLIPKQPLSLTALVSQLDNIAKKIKAETDQQVVKDVEKAIAKYQADTNGAELLQLLAFENFQKRNLEACLLLQLGAVKARSEDPLFWINLTGYLNMGNVPHLSVTILDALTKSKKDVIENSPVAQNNYGHALISLGKIEEGMKHYQQCVAIDSLHPEALSGMGTVFWARGQMSQAVNCFKKSLCVRYTSSDVEAVKKVVKQQSKTDDDVNMIIDFSGLLDFKSSYYGYEKKNIYTSIGLERLVKSMPPVPKTLQEGLSLKPAYKEYIAQVIALSAKFDELGSLTPVQLRQSSQSERPNGRRVMVNAAIEQLQRQYSDLTRFTSLADGRYLQELAKQHGKEKDEAEKNCPKAPVMVGLDQDWLAVQRAYEQKCCKIITPIDDKFISAKNTFYTARFEKALSNWKQYLDGLADHSSNDPSLSRQAYLYSVTSSFLDFVVHYAIAIGDAYQQNPYCHDNLSEEEMNELIELAEISLNCRHPKIKVSLGPLLSASMEDCDKIQFELNAGANIKIAESIKEGKVTVFVGAKADTKFAKNILKAGVSAGMLFSFENGRISDFGILADASIGSPIKISSVTEIVPEIKGEATLTINSGLTAGVKAPIIGSLGKINFN